MRLDLTLIQIEAVKAMLANDYDEDERLKLGAIEGETDAFELVRKLLDRIEADEGDDAALTAQMAARKERRDRVQARIKNTRDAVSAIMACAKLDKLALPEATLSLRELPAKLVVNAKEAVPEEYTVPKPVPSMDAIKAAFSPDDRDLPNWLAVEPARPSLTVRRK